MADYSLFKSKAPGVMEQLMADFDFSVEDAAAVLGNIGGETGGFRLLQEVKPIVSGSKGGLGWCQWTGPRRRTFEAYCKRNGLDPYSDKANYAYLFVELKGIEGTEKTAVDKTKRAKGLSQKTVAFMEGFLRPGIPHTDTRILYAKLALQAYNAAHASGEVITLPSEPSAPIIEKEDPVTPTDEIKPPDVPAMNKYNKVIGGLIGALIPLVAMAIPDIANLVGAPYDQLLIALGGVLGTYIASPNAKK